ncbi:MFS transporter [Burkholderia sp. IMCC1007]|uniref:MFS transporter n=1 Tax=Burkholderia sp. IMCC1007 TaxID=3004104 RepID=UPI0022B598A5|nr:MFS transporter [Burkholderia sp. IMCC1007]
MSASLSPEIEPRSSRLPVVVCFIILVLEGYDLAMFGTIAPSLLDYVSWQMTASEIGVIGSASGIGLVIGAFSAAFLVDRFGRKSVLLTSTAIFSGGMLVSSMAPTPLIMGLGRVLTGLGAGTVMPAAVAMLIEFSPTEHRQRTASNSFIGVGFGGIAAGLLSAWLLPISNFRAMFAIGTVALLIVPVLIKIFPESPAFLMSIGDEVRAREIASRYGITDLEIRDVQKGQHNSACDRLRQIFSGKRLVVTVLFWLVMILVQTTATLSGYWIPVLMRSGGYSFGSALLMVTVLYTGFILGTLVTARIADCVGSRKVIVSGLLIAAASYILLSFRLDIWAGFLLVALIGMGGPAMQTLTNTFVASYYPASLRGTGIGMAVGVGRVGAILGPLYGGAIAAGLPVTAQFYAFGIPAAAAALVMSMAPLSTRHHSANTRTQST